MRKKITYADAGVDRGVRTDSKTALRILKGTYRLSNYGKVLRLPFGNVFPLGSHRYLDLQIEGVGTKVLLAQLAEKYDTIGVDGVAMAVNDVIRSGARPLALADNIHAQVSDPRLIKELLKGIMIGAKESSCIVPSGEIGDVGDVIKGIRAGKSFDLIVAAIGEIWKREQIIKGDKIQPGDAIIGLRSSGIHSNGVSLARKILFKQWGGRFEPHDVPDGLDKEIIEEALEPTKIYVRSFLKVAEEVFLKGAVHITGDSYLKFTRLSEFSPGIGFLFDNFDPHPIFNLIQQTARTLGKVVTDEEMFKTFNMGWGFGVIVEKSCVDKVLGVFEKNGTQARQIGRITKSNGIKILHGRKRLMLK